MRHLLINLLLLALPCTTQAQRLNPADYIYPVTDVPGLYSANFGEMRPGHFHGGIDIKTDGAEGKPLVATADGSITRMVVSPSGFGRALYLTLANGKTAVYGHLQRFTPELEEFVYTERLRRKSHSLDLNFETSRWPVKQGERIGYSGNSGGSMGPHLHYELRDTPSQEPLNLIREGVMRPQDTQPPRIVRIHYVEIDTLQSEGICQSAPLESYAVTGDANGRNHLTSVDTIEVGRKGFFIAEVTDRRNREHNTFGVWRITASCDGKPYFEYRMDRFSFALSRCCDAVSYYPLQRASRNEVIRLAQLAGAPDCFYTQMVERGVVRTQEGEVHRIGIEVEDDCGNCSHLDIAIRGRAEAFRATADPTATPLYADRESIATLGREAILRLPTGALYENSYFHPEVVTVTPTDSSIILLSPVYRFIDPTTPLRYAASVTIRAVVPQALQLRTVMATYSDKGRYSYIGGAYLDGAVTTQSRATGSLCLVADTVAPRIRPLFKANANLSQANALRFAIGDNFSGIASYTLTIDDEWIPCDRFPMKGTLVAPLRTRGTQKSHQVYLDVTDQCGNVARWQGKFYR